MERTLPGWFPLEVFANNPELRGQLESLLVQVEEALAVWGQSVPRFYLKENCPIPGIRFEGDYPVDRLVKALEQLRDLLGRGE